MIIIWGICDGTESEISVESNVSTHLRRVLLENNVGCADVRKRINGVGKMRFVPQHILRKLSPLTNKLFYSKHYIEATPSQNNYLSCYLL